MEVVISLGSNINPEENIRKAKLLLLDKFPGITFSKYFWTNPIGICSGKFLNLYAIFETDLSQEEVKSLLKKIENNLGDNHNKHLTGRIIIDIDLNKYNNEKIKDIIWLKNIF